MVESLEQKMLVIPTEEDVSRIQMQNKQNQSQKNGLKRYIREKVKAERWQAQPPQGISQTHG